MNIYDELLWRGLVHQVSDELKVRAYVSRPGASVYCGFYPTAESLHVGNLVPLLSLVRFKLAGHKPLFLLGGATSLIGDPSGKDRERELSSRERLSAQADKIAGQVAEFFARNTGEEPEVVNNADWIERLTAIELLRDVGKHFTVNWMLAKDSVKGRIGREDVGISYTEFSYMILQGYDFLHLYLNRGTRLQIGGSDQWGNITAGCELIRRKGGDEAFALTFPLITTASGRKFGKSEKGAIFLSAGLTSPYAFYQYFYNTEDQDAVRFLKYFTLLSREEIEALAAEVAERPHLRAAQKALAAAVTRMVHGEEELSRVLAASEALFGSGDIARVDAATLKSALKSAPSRTYARDGLPDLPQVLVDLGLCASKGQAKKDIQAGAVSLNGRRTQDATAPLADAGLIEGKVLVVRKGKKHYGLVVAR